VTRWPAGKTHEQQLRIFERKDDVPSLMAVANHMWGVVQGGMSKSFRDWHVDQQLLLPPAVQDFVPEGHLARFVVSLVRESWTCRRFMRAIPGRRGSRPITGDAGRTSWRRAGQRIGLATALHIGPAPGSLAH
jgi:hypothetical protein